MNTSYDLAQLLHYAGRIPEHIAIPKPDHGEPERGHRLRSRGVVMSMFRVVVLSTVQLDDESELETREVREIGPDRMVSAEVQAQELTATQMPPEAAFGVGRLAAETAGKLALGGG